MTITEITDNYFSDGTKGYKILRYYYKKYQDIFHKTIHTEFNDFKNQILINVSSINFEKDIQNIEAYIIGSIKIQCRVQLDKAIKFRDRINIVELKKNNSEEEEGTIQDLPDHNTGPENYLDAKAIFNSIQYFKTVISFTEVELLNNLIDEIPRKEIADKKKININSLDTQIRRLRIKFMKHLKKSGFTFKVFEKYEK